MPEDAPCNNCGHKKSQHTCAFVAEVCEVCGCTDFVEEAGANPNSGKASSSTRTELILEDWLTPDQVALYEQFAIYSDARSQLMCGVLTELAKANARISRMGNTAEAREKEIRRRSEQCQRINIAHLPEWPRMVRAIRACYAEGMEPDNRVGNAAFAVECADDFARAAMEAIGPDAFVQDVGMEKP